MAESIEEDDAHARTMKIIGEAITRGTEEGLAECKRILEALPAGSHYTAQEAQAEVTKTRLAAAAADLRRQLDALNRGPRLTSHPTGYEQAVGRLLLAIAEYEGNRE